ncbi:MAG: lipopolysaccharide heptosyltransferase II [Betaproteobacteria bacterium]|nr:lipopolysaccharide heptosyltransferase II [Betaproteobacteria bacterium]
MYKILVVAPSWVGDAVLAQPLFRRLHQRHPGLILDILAPSWSAPLLRRMPEVHEVIHHSFGHGELKVTERYRLGRKLARAGYQQAIVLPNSLKAALVPLFAGIPLRTGFVGELRRGVLNDSRRLFKERFPLMVERFALLAERPGAPLERPVPFPCLAVDDATRRATLARLGLEPRRPVAALCPGAEYGPAKRWPVSHFAELAGKLAPEFEVWLIGSSKDRAIGEEIRAAGGACINLCGRTSLDEAIDLLSGAALVVTNDSGLMHVAAALGRPLVALYGSSSPGFTPPLSQHARVLKLDLPCSPCFQRECPLGHFKCMIDLTPDQVMAMVAGLRP